MSNWKVDTIIERAKGDTPPYLNQAFDLTNLLFNWLPQEELGVGDHLQGSLKSRA